MSARIYIHCNGGEYFRAQGACPVDGWTSPEVVELADAATALESAGQTPSIAALRALGVSDVAVGHAVIMEFGDEDAVEAIVPGYRHHFAASLGPPFGAFEDLLARRGAKGEITILRRCFPGTPRLELARVVGSMTRYVELHVADDPRTPPRFSFLFGQYGGADHNIDGRRGGDLDQVLAFVEAWLVELRPSSALPSPPPTA